MTATANNTTTTRIDGTAALFIAHLVSSVIYHADGNKGMCDLHGGRRHGFVERKDPILLERQLDATQDLFDGEYSSILAAPLGFLPSLDHLIRPRQHIRRNRQADLFGGLEIDDELELGRLFHG